MHIRDKPMVKKLAFNKTLICNHNLHFIFLCLYINTDVEHTACESYGILTLDIRHTACDG